MTRIAPLCHGLGLTLGLTLSGAAPALAHTLDEEIADCACDAACFTDEVQGLGCTTARFSFESIGLPDASHTLMTGMTAHNQQFPRPHSYHFTLPRDPELASHPSETRPGAIGVAVNGVPIFSPDTQGPVQASGRPVSAAEAGELDSCGGHAGRGDDYHYHRAPNCLIEELGAEAVEQQLQPIGYAADGFPILALGWFDPDHDIEDKLDACRGATDAAGRYFYNVEHDGDQAVLDCFSGREQRISRDGWSPRKDADGRDIVGIPVPMAVTAYSQQGSCQIMSGTLRDEQLARPDGSIAHPATVDGAIFWCSSSCYGHFIETRAAAPGRTLTFTAATAGCAEDFAPAHDNGFLAYRSAP
ncbi:YHYH protein [Frigidibacter sp. ROC022]|uniref:YHYH protein n=1 Tax=Frigidibacter sp. ROC022 TaxID=2971796 RepID=UPI00215B6D93|nr:YHYH protein [Frigidibacter sp. ROC022]MCR8722784.1 YHYH protein [Frigidibacter sp. ROC022]